MRRPPSLQSGDEVIILSTARAIQEQELSFAVSTLESWGLRVRLGKTIGIRENQFAGSDTLRVQDFQDALNDPKIRAIFCARGGYGTVRIMEQLDFTRFTHEPKWIIGYSDVTVLHSVINTYLGIKTLHASMPINFETNTSEALKSLRKALWGEKLDYSFPSHPLNQKGRIKAQLVGGNMSILYALQGTKHGLNVSGRILFLEDLDEYLYHIDRMTMSFETAGKWQSISGLVCGGLTDMNDNTIPFGKTAEEIIRERIWEFEYPVCFNFPAGHIANNCALVFGSEYNLEVGSEGCRLYEG